MRNTLLSVHEGGGVLDDVESFNLTLGLLACQSGLMVTARIVVISALGEDIAQGKE